MEFIDCVYYINLDHRTDRKEKIEAEIDRLGVPSSKVVRIPAIYTKGFGILGCGLSHLKTLELFLNSPHKTCLVLEDDFQITLDINYTKYLLRSIFDKKIPFDLIMLGGNFFQIQKIDHPFLRKVLDAQTTSAYIISKDFTPTLIENLRESTTLLKDEYEKTQEKTHEYCLDIYWKKLQAEARWYCLYPKVGIQRESYSDIEDKVTNYGV
jgi:hypothetical protein